MSVDKFKELAVPTKVVQQPSAFSHPTFDGDDAVLIPRGLVLAACYAIDNKRESPEVLKLLREVAMSVSDKHKAITDDARECLLDVVSHHRDFVQACCCTIRHAKGDDVSYWEHQVNVLNRMKEQAQRTLVEFPQVATKDSSVVQQSPTEAVLSDEVSK